ncbi:MAG: hypothetical protein KGI58_01425 [Patescibacteria group bacterium]|nr:hypothetical protein [Patescibacteria group bacterium]
MKFIRIFLLILIIIGTGLLLTQKIWVPKFVNIILKNNTQQEQPINDGTTKIAFPEGGETFIPGQTYTLKWSYGPNPLDIFLIDTSLRKYGASVSLSDRVYRITNTGSYEYTFPKNLKDGIYQFRIGNVISNNFKVTSTLK